MGEPYVRLRRGSVHVAGTSPPVSDYEIRRQRLPTNGGTEETLTAASRTQLASPQLRRYAFTMEGATVISETPRLQLRQVEVADAAFIYRLLNEPSWLENIGDRGIYTTADAARYITDQIRGPHRVLGYGMCLVQRKEDGVPVGLCGLVKRDFLTHPDLGFALLPEFAGQGYAAEAAGSVIAAAGSLWRISQLYAITNLRNHRAVRLLERLGFERERSCALPQGGHVELYARPVMGARLKL